MKIFLLWKYTSDRFKELSPDQVAADLRSVFAPLFADLPAARIRSTLTTTLVYLELPVSRWKPALFQEDEETWVFAAEYPVNARAALSANGVRFEEDRVIPTLCRNLQENTTSLLEELAPPFSLVWFDKRSSETFVQNDGLGHSQLFEYQDENLWAVTNKVFALRALNVSLEPDSEQWAVRFALGWFPRDMTGFKRLRFLSPATQLRVGLEGIYRSNCDVLSKWLSTELISKKDCLEMARSSIIKLIEEVTPLWDKPGAGLSGGWDSRAVVACLRVLDTQFSVRVRGHPERYDVVIASRLARIAGVDLKVKSSGGLPSDSAKGCRHSVSRALLWQAGQLATQKHVSFLANRKYLGGGSVNIMGAAGEICRGYYANKIGAQGLRTGQYTSRFVEEMMSRMPPFMRGNLHDLVRSTVLDAYKQADKYGLDGLRRLDFFYLFERTRRWRSGALGSQPGQAFTPFLNPDLIKATFNYPSRELATNPFHRYIIATNAQDWLSVPYADEWEKNDADAGMFSSVAQLQGGVQWQLPLGNETYNRLLHWKVVGKPLIHEALSAGGFWTEIFDPDLADKQWRAAPDALAIAHLIPSVVENEDLSESW